MTNQNPDGHGERNRTERMWLPGFYAGSGDDKPVGSWPPAPPDRNRSRTRRSAFATGALIAGGAAATGYLAYAVVAATPGPSLGTKASTTTGNHSAQAQITPAPIKPTIHVPIATTGGSGATRHRDDGNGKDN